MRRMEEIGRKLKSTVTVFNGCKHRSKEIGVTWNLEGAGILTLEFAAAGVSLTSDELRNSPLTRSWSTWVWECSGRSTDADGKG
jgi:hypothetical protein